MRSQPLPCPEFRLIGEIGRKETAHVPHERFLDRFESGAPQRLKDPFSVRRALAASTARACRCRLTDLEIDVLGPGVGLTVNDLPQRLKRADIVFATARMALEAMIVNRAGVTVTLPAT